MFDIAFSELIVVACVALIVIGPERLPKVARTVGAITGRMQRYVAQVKDEINREARFEELQQLQQEIQTTADTAKQKLQSTVNHIKHSDNIEDALPSAKSDAPNMHVEHVSVEKR
jgi:sec-independent protein translocase protein TatB